MGEPLQILLIDDDRADRIAVRRVLRKSGLSATVVEAADGDRGAEAFGQARYDCILLDYHLPDRDGAAVLNELVAQGDPPVPIIMLTGMSDEGLALQLLEEGAVDYLIKDELEPSLVKRAIRYALARHQVLQREIVERKRVARLVEEKAELLDELARGNRLLESRNQRLAELYESAHRFVDNVSHEFRTPLTVIKELAALLEDGVVGSLAEEQRELVEIILHRVDDLMIMVNDMLDTSKLGTGLLGMAHEACRIDDIVERHRGTLVRRAAAAGADFVVEVAPDLPVVYCDPEKIGRVIINLAVNAIRFSGRRVVLWVRRQPDADMVTVGITDDGPGIAPEHLEQIFERFRQVGEPSRTSTKGFGLGLSIAKELVHLNFGTIGVESEVGVGSTFSFSIPIAGSVNQAVAAPAEGSGEPVAA